MLPRGRSKTAQQTFSRENVWFVSPHTGIFAYINYLVEKDRKFIMETLLNGLSRLEYRGYDSAGFVVEGDDETQVMIFKQVGKVKELRKKASFYQIVG